MQGYFNIITLVNNCFCVNVNRCTLVAGYLAVSIALNMPILLNIRL